VTIANPLAGLVAYLVGDTNVYTATAGRVYGGELPKSQAGEMPRATVLCALSGGGGPASDAPELRVTCDVSCYGATPYAALELYLTVRAALRTLARDTGASALLHSAVETAGPLELREPDVRWPVVWSSWRVIASERPVT